MNELERKAGMPETPGYAYARRDGNRLYVAGQLPINAEGDITGKNDAYAQAKQCLANLAAVLGCYDFNLNDVHQMTIYVAGDREALTEAWRSVREQFADAVPPAALIGVALLGYDEQLVEIDATVVKRP